MPVWSLCAASMLLPLFLACGDKDDDDTAGDGGAGDGGAGDGGAGDGGTGDGGTGDGGTGDGGTGDGGAGEALADAVYFEGSSTLESGEVVPCMLEDGTETECLALSFGSNPVPSGPFCPETVAELGGLGVYDGPTNPGFQVLGPDLWAAMEADGYDIVDEDGNVNVEAVSTGARGGPSLTSHAMPPPPPGGAACLEAVADDALLLRFLVPRYPVERPTPVEIGTVDLIGVGVDGAPMNGTPPSVVDNDGKIPALDPCGGHHDPAGYYHWHMAAAGITPVLAAYGITEVACTLIAQDDTALIGFAKDGYPLYGSAEVDGAVATGLDDCGGHEGATADFPEGTYHYHASASAAPSLPSCLVGYAATDAFGVE